MKKRILIAVLVLAFCLLCGCGGAGSQTKSPSDDVLEAALTASFTMSYRDYTATDAEICVELCPTGSGIRATIRFQCGSDMWYFESSLIH